MIRSFWLGSTSAKMSTSWAFFMRASGLICRISWPVRTDGIGQPHLAGDGAGDQPVVPGNHLQGDPQVGQSVDGLDDSRFGRIVDHQESQ